MPAVRLGVIVPMLAAAAAAGRAQTGQPLEPPTGEPAIEVPFELDRNKILVPLRVNGSGPFDFIFDSGAPQNVIFNGAAADSMMLVVTGQAQVFGAGEGGAIEASIVGEFTLGLGDRTISDRSALLISARPEVPDLRDRPLAGIVGLGILSRFVVELDFQRRVMRLYEPDAYVYAGDGSALDLWLEAGHPHVNATWLGADGTSTEIELVVDTGARPALIVGLPNEAGIEPPAGAPRDRIGKGLSGEIFARLGRVRGLRLAVGEPPGRLVVESVRPGSPAEEAGIRSGDHIISIAGLLVGDDIGLDAVDQLPRGGDGVTVSIVLERADELIEVELALRRLL